MISWGYRSIHYGILGIQVNTLWYPVGTGQYIMVSWGYRSIHYHILDIQVNTFMVQVNTL